jgi:Family of unknown function (DUF5906)
MKLTFLEGYKPLTKRFTPEGVDAYPQVKRVTSHEFEIPETPDGLKERFQLIQKHASNGCGLLKGSLIRQLVKESRSGMTNNDAPAYNIVLDIDGVRPMDLHMQPPFDNTDINSIAEYFINWLPQCFRDASYILHASASLGTKPGVFSLHLDFLLKTPIPVQLLKDYLLWLNFNISGFEHQMLLTATGTGLRYKLDRTLADNSRIIYIGNPIFEGVEDPIPNTDDRLQLKIKNNNSVDLSQELEELDTAKLQRLIRNKISYLRQSAGLPERKEKLTATRINGQMISVVTNPDNMHMMLSYERGPYVYYNINGGDSNAYYVYKTNPTVVYNFKGEPNFLFEQADPESYNTHLETYGFGSVQQETEDGDEEPTTQITQEIPLVFRDKGSDKFYNATYDPQTQHLLEVNMVTSEKRCTDWMKEHQGIPPDVITSVSYEFKPNDPRGVDMPNKFINRYIPSEVLTNPPELPAEFQELEYGYAHHLQGLCPTIHKIIYSIMGDGALEYEHFINWLSFVVQNKEKCQTAWVCHGTQGTGKGVFMTYVMTPILGKHHTSMKRTEEIDEKFNSWMQQCLLVVVDEFNASDSKQKSAINNKLKQYITDKNPGVREMHTEQKSPENFCNFLFFSNDDAPVPITQGDRRFNVAPLQKVSLVKQYPGITETLIEDLKNEMPMFAAFLLSFKTDGHLAKTALENEAKNAMRVAGRTAVDDFCISLREGCLNHFLNILDMEEAPNFAERILPARNLLHAYIRRIKNEEFEQRLHLHEVRILFHALVGDTNSTAAFGKLLGRRGVETKRFYHEGRKKSGVDLTWQLEDINIDSLMTAYNIEATPPHIRSN